jgi:hypothetical protein
MDNIPNQTVIRQCISELAMEDHVHLLSDRYNKKLFTAECIQLFVIAQLERMESYGDMEKKIRANTDLQQLLKLKSISGSQISRKLEALPTETIQALFLSVIEKIKVHTHSYPGPSKNLGQLHLIDSTNLKLPPTLGQWAHVTKDRNGVKMHLELIVASPEIAYTNQIIPSTGNMSDYEGSDWLVTSEGATYVMDRGYVSYSRMDKWVKNNILFVVRVAEHHHFSILVERPVPDQTKVLRDMEVRMGKKNTEMKEKVRLVEFYDEKGRLYRVVTTRWDLEASEIAAIYKHRWLIELHFKWLKQHVRLTKLYSTKPQAIWNQMFLALIAHALTLYIQLKTETKKSTWDILQLLRTYAHQSWEAFENELTRRPTRTSKGRQKVPKATEPYVAKQTTDVGIIKTEIFRTKKPKNPRKKTK